MSFNSMLAVIGIIIVQSGQKSGIKTIVVGHLSSSISAFGSIIHAIFKRRFASLGIKVAVSVETKKYMFGRSCQNVRVITNGIDFERFKYSARKRTEMRAKLGVLEHEVLIVQIGRISKQKNQLFSTTIIHSLLEQKRFSDSSFSVIKQIKI